VTTPPPPAAGGAGVGGGGVGAPLQLLHSSLKMLTFVYKSKSHKGLNPNKQIH